MSILRCYEKSPYLSIKHNTYFPVYEELFSRYIGKQIVFVEVGVLNGGSLFMWREFLGENARIIGIDLNPDAKKWEEKGFEIFIGSQADRKFWARFHAEVGDVDVVLDDGGHTYEQQILTAECSLPIIRDGGLLVVEDTHTSYMKEFGGPSPFSFVSYAKNKIEGINNRFSAFASDKKTEQVVWSIQFFESIISLSVNRRLAGIQSQPTSNDGLSLEAIDFRRDDPVTVSAEELIKAFKY